MVRQIFCGSNKRREANEPFEYYTLESTDEPTSRLNNIPWNRLTSPRATSIRIVGKVALYSVVKRIDVFQRYSTTQSENNAQQVSGHDDWPNTF